MKPTKAVHFRSGKWTGSVRVSAMQEPAIERRHDMEQPRENKARSRPFRLAIVVTHPIQYFAPLFKRLAQRSEVELTVLYSSLMGAEPYHDPGFGMTLSWDIPLLEGYQYKILRNYGPGKIASRLSFLSPGVISEIGGGRHDIVIVFGWNLLTYWMAFASARLAGIPFMLYGDSISINEGRHTWLKATVKKLFLRSLFRRASAFLFQGTFNRMFYQSYGAPPGRFFFVPYPIDNDSFAAKAEQARQLRGELRARYGIPADVVLLLFVGKLLPRKRPADVLAVLKSLQPALTNLGAAFVGEGELRTALEAEIARQRLKNTFLLGFKNQGELPELYAMSDIFVLPSQYEPWGLVTNEAMACRLPVVLSNMTGASGDLVKEGQNGFVYACGDVEALACAVQELAVDVSLRQRMGQRSFEIIQGFGYDRCVEGILEAVAFTEANRDGG